MPPYRTPRPVTELHPALGDELSAATGRRLAVSLVVRDDGGTDIITHDRDQAGRVVEDVPVETLDKVVVAHKRPSPPPPPPPSPTPQPARALAFPSVAPVTGKSFL